jgi:D-serine transporter
VILSNLDMHPILLAWLVALILHAAVGSATVAMMGATAIVAPMLPLYPGVSPEIIAIAIGSGAIGCTIVTDSLFWLVKQYCGQALTKRSNTIPRRPLSLRCLHWPVHSCFLSSSERKET